MTFQGAVVIDLIGAVLLLWVMNLTRRGRLYVGYAVVLGFSIAAALVVVSTPPLLSAATHAVGAVFPASALTMGALLFLFVILIYILSQLTIIAHRLSTLVQELAIRNNDGKVARQGTGTLITSSASDMSSEPETLLE